MGYSCYDVIPQDAGRILVVAATSGHGPCSELVNDLVAHLSRSRPKAKVEVISASVGQDFAALMYAPTMIKHGQSTFGLWAGFSSRGQVISVPMMQPFALNTTPDLGTGWTWRDCPVLDPDFARTSGIRSVKGILKWVAEN